jgi:MOSC domain-containing protein YiiM
MTIERIYTRPRKGEPQRAHERVRVVAGSGIEDDRYFGRHDEPGQNITFIEAEEIEAFLSANHRAHDLSGTGRNVVTRGVRLNALVGKEFAIGNARFRGIDLCEPCRGLGRKLESTDVPAATVVKSLVHRAGLRADVLGSGEIAVGDPIRVV